jgi:serine phosphatase RsbU (regulator of sigma subunit)
MSAALFADTTTRAAKSITIRDNLEYRWGDSPLDERGRPAWAFDAATPWQNFNLPGEPPGRGGSDNLWVRVKLPGGVFDTPALMTSGVHQEFQVFIDGRVIYRFGEFDAAGRGIFAGYRWHHIIPLPRDFADKYVYFRIYSHFQSIGFSSLVLGDASTHVITIVRRDVHKLILGVLITLAGVLVLLYFIIGRKKNIGLEQIDDRIYLYFSIFTIFMGIAIASDTALKELIYDAPMAWIHIRLAGMICFAFGLMGFLLHINEIRHKILLQMLMVLFLLYAAASLILVAGGFITVMDIILPYNIILLVSIPVLLFCVVSSSLRANIDAIIITGGFFVLLLAGVRDALMDLGLLPRSEFTHHWGMLVFIAALGVVLVRRFTDTYNRFYEYRQNLELARNIQRSSLPKSVPVIERLHIAAKYIPMHRVGGDFYGFHVVDSRRLGVLLSDVSGHGVPAAMVSSMIKLSFDLARGQAHNPPGLLGALNTMLIDNIEKNFITACYCYLDLESMKMYVGNAGHPSLYLWKNSGERLVEIRPRGMFLGRFDEIYCVTEEAELERGDKIVIYTDGITEAVNRRGDIFGDESLESFIRQWHRLPAGDFITRLLDHVRDWSGRGPESFDDDLTIIVIDVA